MMIPRKDIFDKTVGPQGKFSRFEAWFFIVSQAEIEEPNAGLIKFGHRDLMKVFGWSRRAVVEFLEELQAVGKLKINDPQNDPLGTTYLITNFSSYSGVVSKNDPENDPPQNFVLNYPNKDLNNSSKKDLRSNLDGSKEREGGTGGEKNQSGASAPLAPDGAHGVSKPIKHKKGTPFTKTEQFADSGGYIPVWLAAFQTWLDYRVEIGKPIRAANALKITFEKFQTADELKASVEQSIMNGWQGLFPARSVVVQKESWIDRRLRELKAEEEAEEAHSTQLKALGGSRRIDLRGSNGKGRVQ